MKEHNFKFGDRVRLIDPSDWGVATNGDGLIVGFDIYIRVEWQGTLRRSLGTYYPHKADEIERVVNVGEQLLFSFMAE